MWTETDRAGVIVLSRDGTAAGAENVRAGRITATWDSNFAQLGAAWVEMMSMHLVDGIPLDKLPAEVTIPATRYDITNIDEYAPQLEREVTLSLKNLK